MKKIVKKNFFGCLSAIVLAGFWAYMVVIPSPLPAQDIDDVLKDIDPEFSIDVKQDLKMQNRQTANEQNREDIKIVENEGVATAAAGQSLTVTLTALIDPSLLFLDHLNVLGEKIDILEQVPVSGTQTTTVLIPSTVQIVPGQSATVYLNLTCQSSGGCEVSLNISGTVTCNNLQTGFMTLGENKVISTTCTT